ncbi:putative terpene synthase 2 [Quercus suber]|uniref:Terpene synthase 2 n=1 Tax=Quercus suber TaxID=58331 RepID=A0AAW0LMP5_QUESU
MKKLVKAYFEEAIWLKEKYIPTMEEYMSNAPISCGYPMLSTKSFVGMGDIVTKEVLEWVFKELKIVIVASIINKLMDDVVSNEQEVHAEFQKQIVNAWKDINKECITKVPVPLHTHVVNFARVMDLLYKDEYACTQLGGMMF